MIVPVRCFTCGKVIGGLYKKYQERLAEGEKSREILDSLEVDRYCCRRIFLSHADVIKDIAPFD